MSLWRAPTVALVVLCAATTACSGSSHRAAHRATTSTTAPTSAAVTAIGVTTDPKLGQILVDGAGLTLYHNVNENSSTTVCTGFCTNQWIPEVVSATGVPTTTTSLPGAFG